MSRTYRGRRSCYQAYRAQLKLGGVAVIEVPGSELFDDYNRELKHFRRGYFCIPLVLIQPANYSRSSKK
jgi:hypothetical protein